MGLDMYLITIAAAALLLVSARAVAMFRDRRRRVRGEVRTRQALQVILQQANQLRPEHTPEVADSDQTNQPLTALASVHQEPPLARQLTGGPASSSEDKASDGAGIALTTSRYRPGADVGDDAIDGTIALRLERDGGSQHYQDGNVHFCPQKLILFCE